MNGDRFIENKINNLLSYMITNIFDYLINNLLSYLVMIIFNLVINWETIEASSNVSSLMLYHLTLYTYV